MSSHPGAYLFVPASRPERYSKAVDAAASAVVVDLEDAVAPDDKDAARASLQQWLDPLHPVIVRINADGSDWFGQDLQLLSHPGVAAVMLPKAEDCAAIDRVAGSGRPVIALIETARGIAHARQIAQRAGVSRLAFGSIDLQVDLGIGGDREELHFARSELVLASRLAELPPPIDGVTTAIDDPEQLRRDADLARRFGFGAKLCIHPRQLAVVNAAFAPSSEQLAWARNVLDAIGHSGGGAVSVDGKMVDRPVLLLARRILESAGEADDAHPSKGTP
ncbi:CoA ester lyase [Herbaspirillum sp. YR522]|uniref:HpcH/HpaI aldolase/citrate lyase family protein n=1 Tax=Herbaspirillum sp. YR522 TaxID=1144342 RepID=UPI00026FC4A7|nr:CoA ester lyase [Herbaspirillum sp. YR522]EJN07622.1 citrate lyase beta subunit [Herbaspirillum sp. YR522]